MSSKKTTTSQQQSTSTSSLDPAYAALVYGNAARAQGLANTPYQPYAGQRVAGFTPDQVMAQGLFGNIAGGQVGGDTLNSAVAAAKAAGGYAPALVSAPTTATFDYAPAKAAAVAPAVAGLVDRSAVRDVGADSLAGADLSAYTNPFTQSVIDT
ncbi:MAG TPA: hypothetical protein VG939_19770, partial [Caulobacteraceae bacterium]|nr:hypothetical protein [Caulobacteraceae bacterium]